MSWRAKKKIAHLTLTFWRDVEKKLLKGHCWQETQQRQRHRGGTCGSWRAYLVFDERIIQARLRGAWSLSRALDCLVEEFELHSEVSGD